MEGVLKARQAIERRPTEKSSSKIDLDSYKKLFCEISSAKTGGVFVIDQRNKSIVLDIFLYFLNQPGNLDLKKGLWIEGPIGTGKSMLMYVFSEFMKFLKYGYHVYICGSITTEYALTGDLDRYLQNQGGYIKGPAPICFDELGREPIPSSFYGQKLNVMQHILHVRYSYWQLYGTKTYVTTNTDADMVQDLYGDYIRDRRAEMFNLITIGGNSMR